MECSIYSFWPLLKFDLFYDTTQEKAPIPTCFPLLGQDRLVLQLTENFQMFTQFLTCWFCIEVYKKPGLEPETEKNQKPVFFNRLFLNRFQPKPNRRFVYRLVFLIFETGLKTKADLKDRLKTGFFGPDRFLTEPNRLVPVRHPPVKKPNRFFPTKKPVQLKTGPVKKNRFACI
ncbi:hypothetical protein Hanom_Chr12g01082491 [Helianthus anomalus]